MQHRNSLLLSQLIDIIGIFDFTKNVYNFFGSKSHSQANCSTSPSLGECLEYDKVGIFIQLFEERRSLGKIIVSLIQHHQSFELTKYLYNFRTEQIISCRVIRRAKENQFGVFIGSRQQFIGRELEVIIQQYFPIFHIVHIGTNLIHTISRVDGYDIIFSRFAECTKNQVDGFIATVSKKNMLGGYFFDFRQQRLQFALHRIRIAIMRRIVRVFVCIQENRGCNSFIFISCRRVGF